MDRASTQWENYLSAILNSNGTSGIWSFWNIDGNVRGLVTVGIPFELEEQSRDEDDTGDEQVAIGRDLSAGHHKEPQSQVFEATGGVEASRNNEHVSADLIASSSGTSAPPSLGWS